EGESRTVDVHIRQIRAKLDLKDRLKTLYKMGYRFELT
ncbi:MAG: winged helix-turn-helix domain-containing protein, partial [Clostridia bacterium]|nr:winged helix-turn-helix domain-containing protein [Clostridia bacterium]